jgi:hypothetical protein
MGFYLYLQLGRTASTYRWDTGNDGQDFHLTEYKLPRLAELMLFDATSLISVDRAAEYGVEHAPYRDLMSDRESAVMRFRRRLPQARAAFAWNLVARRSLDAFGQFMTALDWPYVRLDTGEYRIASEETFDQELAFTISALDLPAIAKPGALFGGEGRLSPEWERLLEFCWWSVSAIYEADPEALRIKVVGMPACTDEWGQLLRGYLPRRGALNIPQIERAKRLLNLSPEQEEPWRSFEAALRPWAIFPTYSKVPEKLDPSDVEQMALSLTHRASPLMATLTSEQKRIARRLFRAMGLAPFVDTGIPNTRQR